MKPPYVMISGTWHTASVSGGKEGEREEDWDKDDVLSSGGSYGHF